MQCFIKIFIILFSGRPKQHGSASCWEIFGYLNMSASVYGQGSKDWGQVYCFYNNHYCALPHLTGLGPSVRFTNAFTSPESPLPGWNMGFLPWSLAHFNIPNLGAKLLVYEFFRNKTYLNHSYPQNFLTLPNCFGV